MIPKDIEDLVSKLVSLNEQRNEIDRTYERLWREAIGYGLGKKFLMSQCGLEKPRYASSQHSTRRKKKKSVKKSLTPMNTPTQSETKEDPVFSSDITEEARRVFPSYSY